MAKDKAVARQTQTMVLLHVLSSGACRPAMLWHLPQPRDADGQDQPHLLQNRHPDTT